ncbi:unnamed protein product [Caenorhabditis nigoni]
MTILNEQFFEIDNSDFSWNSARTPQKCSDCSKKCSENSKTLKFEGDAIVLLVGQSLLNLDYKQMRIPAKRNHPESNVLENSENVPKIPKMSTGNSKNTNVRFVRNSKIPRK